MHIFAPHSSARRLIAAGVLAWLLGFAGAGSAGTVSSTVLRSFGFPISLPSGVVGDLVVPIGSATRFTFETGKVAIAGGVGIEQPSVRTRSRNVRGLTAATAGVARVRLLLSGIADGSGNPVTASGSVLVVDAGVSPSTAASSPPPFTFPFEISGGTAFLDVALPIEQQADVPVRIQVVGVSVLDPDGQPFGVLGLELPPAPATPPPQSTPTPTTTPQPEGRCFKAASCNGDSFPAPQEACCHLFMQPTGAFVGGASWCPFDAYDPTTGQCAIDACVTCLPTPTPTPGGCADSATCGGPCSRTCPDGTVVAGQCGGQATGGCDCSAVCTAPTPCGIGECFDTMAQRCTGQACDRALRCPLPNQVCDVSGLRCPCQPVPPPLPHGQICCECKDRTPACFDFSFVEVQPLCPPGCETFIGKECDAATNTCVALAPCASDKDCDDGNPCTIDRCTSSGCAHDCVCVGPGGCNPGPRASMPR